MHDHELMDAVHDILDLPRPGSYSGVVEFGGWHTPEDRLIDALERLTAAITGSRVPIPQGRSGDDLSADELAKVRLRALKWKKGLSGGARGA